VRDEASDGVEVVLGQLGVEGGIHLGDGGVARHALAAVGEGEDTGLAVLLVEFVLDLADDFFQHVLDRQQPRGAAELVDDDREVVAVGAEVAQQLVQALGLRHEGGRTQQRAQVQLGRALQLQQIFRQQDADDVVARSFEHREARVRGVDHDAKQLLVGCLDVQQVHPARGHHDVAGGHVGHAKHAFEHDARFGLDELALLGVGQGFDQLVARVRPGREELDDALEQAAPVAGFGSPFMGEPTGMGVRHEASAGSWRTGKNTR